ncbi:hypothetical protein CYY_007696 [Polysphondylium violaceum]|uniref:Tetratricopeptide-like helical domain-containing protein n=1 Tax=Polysphondylium violaceum TaxID=133409 RepID=A0A8J4UXI5_9MYCE|nr:hypothetical protein CYY_007696 [Polysphondylium violaceum]
MNVLKFQKSLKYFNHLRQCRTLSKYSISSNSNQNILFQTPSSPSSIDNSFTCRSISTTSPLFKEIQQQQQQLHHQNVHEESSPKNEIDKKYQHYISSALEKFKVNSIDAALGYLDKAILLCDNKVQAYLLRGDINFEIQSNHTVDPINDYLKALELVSSTNNVIDESIATAQEQQNAIMSSIVDYYLLKRNIEKAKHYSMKLIEKNPTIDLYKYEYFNLLCYAKKIPEAAEIAKGLYQTKSDYGFLALGIVSRYQNYIDHSESLLRQITKMKQPVEIQTSNPLYNNKYVISKKGGYQRISQKTVEVENQVLFMANSILGDIHTNNKKEYEKGLEFYRNALALSKMGYVYSKMAKALLKMNDYQAALESINSALEFEEYYSSGTATLHDIELRGEILYHLGKYVESVSDYDHYLEHSFTMYPYHVYEIVKRGPSLEKVIISLAHLSKSNKVNLTPTQYQGPAGTIDLKKEYDKLNSLYLSDQHHPITDIKQLAAISEKYCLFFGKYRDLIQQGRVLVDEKDQQDINTRYLFFYNINSLILDSCYLDYQLRDKNNQLTKDIIDNILKDDKYVESNQPFERQEIHKNLIKVFSDFIQQHQH